MRINSEMVSENPNMHADSDWEAHHYKCTLTRPYKTPGGKRRRKQMTVFFSMGLGACRDPTVKGVLNCLISDTTGVEDRDFEEWASDYGYDTDSRRAEHTYTVCVKQGKRLRTFLGDTFDEWCEKLQDY